MQWLPCMPSIILRSNNMRSNNRRSNNTRSNNSTGTCIKWLLCSKQHKCIRRLHQRFPTAGVTNRLHIGHSHSHSKGTIVITCHLQTDSGMVELLEEAEVKKGMERVMLCQLASTVRRSTIHLSHQKGEQQEINQHLLRLYHRRRRTKKIHLTWNFDEREQQRPPHT